MSRDKHELRLVYAHNGVDTYDPLFLKRFEDDFRVYLVTFRTPTKVSEKTSIIKLPDLGDPLRVRKLNNLRIACATLWRIVQMRRCLQKLKPQLVVGNWVSTYGLYAMFSGRRPFILFAWHRDIVVDPYRSPFHRAVTIRVIKSADLVLIDSDIQRRALLSLGCPPGKIVLFPWVNLNDLSSANRDPTYRRKLDWRHNLIVVSVRKHEPDYSVDTLIRAIPIVVSRFPAIRFLIFGAGTQTNNLIRMTREMKLSKFVHFAGDVPRKDLLDYVRDCDVYVSTSHNDGCSSSLLEAMYFGLPVVVTSIPGNSEWIRHGKNGLMFERNDSKGLASEILRLAANPGERKAFAKMASKEVRQRVNWKRASAELVRKMVGLCREYAGLFDQ